MRSFTDLRALDLGHYNLRGLDQHKLRREYAVALQELDWLMEHREEVELMAEQFGWAIKAGCDRVLQWPRPMDSKQQGDLVQVKEEPLDIDNGDIEENPFAIEETNLVKSKNLEVDNEGQGDLVQVKEEPLDIDNGGIEKHSLTIEETNLVKSKNLEVENEGITEDKGNIKGTTKSCITCKRCMNNSVNDGIINKKSSECKCVYGDVTIENLVENRNSFDQSSASKLHLNIHAKQKNFICNFCQKSFNFKSDLKKHVNIHTKEKNYVCNFCQKVFNRLSNLKVHINLHTKEKNYICNFCQKSFNQSSVLKLHLNIHTEENSYICNVCQKSFNRKYDLERHLNIHIKEKTIFVTFVKSHLIAKAT
ncbi:uncharacterized protein LOC142322586 [Lycorma delicatula]|uniref:uncharacterized protein LOC142322586 n=1 Tax=Lycorma delicatula TaxID=130591 RepID=UPI003F5107A9